MEKNEWYGNERPRWIRFFNVKANHNIKTLDRVRFNDLEGYVFDVKGDLLTVFTEQKNRLIAYSVDYRDVTISKEVNENYLIKTKNSIIYDAWEMNCEYDRRKVEELKLRKKVGAKYKREFEVKIKKITNVWISNIKRLDESVLEHPGHSISGSYIPIIR